MFKSEKNIYLYEMEVKPNKYAAIVLAISMVSIVFCWLLNELGIFRVGKTEMRIGSIIPLLMVGIPLVFLTFKPAILTNSKTKYYIIAASIVLTASVTTLMTFHTTIMLLYPIFIAMLYRSKTLGIVALSGSIVCTVLSPVIGYMIGSWDIELFKELILIGTNGTAEIVGAYPGILLISVFKIVLYLVLPHLLMVGSCAALMFYVIRLGCDHVENQIELNRISRRDALTGLYNQNFYKEFLNDEKPNCQVGVIFFDINGLKSINDRLGHEYGDLLLKRCAKSITDICNDDSELAFRAGGDEIILLLENATEEDIKNKLAEWKNALKKINDENKTRFYGLNCSMAVGYTVGEMNNLGNLIRIADTFMYKNKAKLKAERIE